MKPPTGHERYLAAISQAKKYKEMEKTMGKKRNLKKWPDLSDRDKRIAKVRAALAEAYDLAAAEQERQQRMGAASVVDERRFPAVRGGSR